MNYNLIVSKIQFYCNWWNDLSHEDKGLWLGQWIRERIEFYDQCIAEWVKLKN